MHPYCNYLFTHSCAQSRHNTRIIVILLLIIIYNYNKNNYNNGGKQCDDYNYLNSTDNNTEKGLKKGTTINCTK